MLHTPSAFLHRFGPAALFVSHPAVGRDRNGHVLFHNVPDEENGSGIPGGIVINFRVKFFDIVVLYALMQDFEFIRLIRQQTQRHGMNDIGNAVRDGKRGETVIGTVRVKARLHGGRSVIELNADLTAVGAEQIVNQQGRPFEAQGDTFSRLVGLPQFRQATLKPLRERVGSRVKFLPARTEGDRTEAGSI